METEKEMSDYIKCEVRVYANGDKFWYLNGELHRIDGPAIEYASGDKEWYLNGKYHRIDGPALEYTNGDKAWYIDDIEYTEADFNKKMAKNPCEGKIVEIDGKKYTLTSLTE